MPISDQEEELIVGFLDDKLNADELSQYNNLYNNSESFRAEVNNYKDILANVLAHKKATFKSEIKEVFNELDSQIKPRAKSRNISFNYYATGIAAAVILLLVLFVPNWISSGKLTNHELYTEYYRPISINNTVRATNEIPKGFVAYEEGNYQKAIPLLRELVNEGEYKQAKIYLGVSLLEINKVNEAEKVLKEVLLNDKDSFNKQYANWYLTLIELKKGNMERVKDQLENIITGRGIYQKEAEKLHDSIK